jgi:hypothetical protein
LILQGIEAPAEGSTHGELEEGVIAGYLFYPPAFATLGSIDVLALAGEKPFQSFFWFPAEVNPSSLIQRRLSSTPGRTLRGSRRPDDFIQIKQGVNRLCGYAQAGPGSRL